MFYVINFHIWKPIDEYFYHKILKVLRVYYMNIF